MEGYKYLNKVSP